MMYYYNRLFLASKHSLFDCCVQNTATLMCAEACIHCPCLHAYIFVVGYGVWETIIVI